MNPAVMNALVLSGGERLFATSKLRQVATRAKDMGFVHATATQSMTRRYHFARDRISQLKLRFANWYVGPTPNCSELGAGGSVDIKAWIEYPAGVYTPVLLSGSATITVADAADSAETDWCPVSIPRNERFWIWTFADYGAGGGKFIYGPAIDTAFGEACNMGTSGVPTTPGAITNNFANGYGPTAIIAMSRRPAIFLAGDSRTWGAVYGNPADGTGLAGILEPSIGAMYAFINLGKSGDLVHQAKNNFSKRLVYAQYCDGLANGYGINDLTTGQTDSQVVSDTISFYGLFPAAWKKYTCTVERKTTGAWTLANGSDQIESGSRGFREAYNPRVLAGHITGQTGYFDIAPVTGMPASTAPDGYWKAPGYTVDGLHGSELACAAIKAAGVVNPYVFAP